MPSAAILTQKKSGQLSLFAPAPAGHPSQPYARFKVCRGFIDDLNRLLPIRVRIELEGRVAAGEAAGEIHAPQGVFRWEFRAE